MQISHCRGPVLLIFKEDIRIVFTWALALGGIRINEGGVGVMLWIMRGPKGQTG
jgi:hypothetical protein